MGVRLWVRWGDPLGRLLRVFSGRMMVSSPVYTHCTLQVGPLLWDLPKGTQGGWYHSDSHSQGRGPDDTVELQADVDHAALELLTVQLLTWRTDLLGCLWSIFRPEAYCQNCATAVSALLDLCCGVDVIAQSPDELRSELHAYVRSNPEVEGSEARRASSPIGTPQG